MIHICHQVLFLELIMNPPHDLLTIFCRPVSFGLAAGPSLVQWWTHAQANLLSMRRSVAREDTSWRLSCNNITVHCTLKMVVSGLFVVSLVSAFISSSDMGSFQNQSHGISRGSIMSSNCSRNINDVSTNASEGM